MIDTIALTLKQNEFEVLDWRKFQKEVFSGKEPYIKYTHNPNIELVGYKPRLTIYDRFGKTARVEFSAPKLLHGNNFEELSNDDFEPLVQKLTSDLKSMGVLVYQWNLRKAEVSKIDYCKNIIFTDYTTSSMIMNELGKIDISAKLDRAQKFFRNDGHSLAYHANSYEISFYDKRKDLEQAKKYGEKRAIEKDNAIQLNLLDGISSDPLEVFRIEYRLNTRRKMTNEFKKHGIVTDLRFESVFKKEYSQKLLLGIWQLLEEKFDVTVHDVDDPIQLLESVFIAKPKTSLRNALAFAFAFGIAGSDNGGINKFKDCITRFSDMRSWDRIKSKLKGINLAPNKTKFEALMQVGKQLEAFEPVHLADYPQLDSVNNSKL